MNVFAAGLNHKTAPVEIREKLSIPTADVPKVLREILENPVIKECMVLSTCNRVDVYGVASSPHKAIHSIKRLFAQKIENPVEEIEEHVYGHAGKDAVNHIFRVASSLDSLVVGEPQILGQMKEGYALSSDNRATGIILNRLMHKAFSAAKKVRTETKIASSAVSIAYAAVELAKKIFGDLTGRSVLLIGAGEMCELAAKHLANNGIEEILVTNRTYERAVSLASEFKGLPILFSEFHSYLKKVDIVISSTGAPDYVVQHDEVAHVIRERKNRSMFFIDIAVPRDIDPKINDIDNVYLYDIDDLQGIIDQNKQEREREAKKAQEIIDTEVEAFAGWIKTLEATPTIVALREKIEKIRKAEIEKNGSALQSLTEEQQKLVETLTVSIINKILHYPTTAIKKEAEVSGTENFLAITRRLFELEEAENKEENNKGDVVEEKH